MGSCCSGQISDDDDDARQDRKISEELFEARSIHGRLHKLLLLGPGNSGKSTFFKQLCQIHGHGFQKKDTTTAVQNISDCIIVQMKQLVEACLENTSQSATNKHKYTSDNMMATTNPNLRSKHSDQKQNVYEALEDGSTPLLNSTISPVLVQAAESTEKINVPREKTPVVYEQLSGIVLEAAEMINSWKRPTGKLTPEMCNTIEVLWSNESIKKSFENRTHLGIVDSAPHFFNNVSRFAQTDYKPTAEDILLVRMPTTGVREEKFRMNNNSFIIVDVGGQRSERKKWIHQFESVHAVLYVTSLSCYDQALYEETTLNAMHESIRLFEIVVNNRYFRATSVIVFFNKSDLFRDKIKRRALKQYCFSDYTGTDNSFSKCSEYIIDRFLDCNHNDKKIIYTHITCATDKSNVERVFQDVDHSVVVNGLRDNGIIL